MRPLVPVVLFAFFAAAVSAQNPNPRQSLPLARPNAFARVTAQVPQPLTLTYGDQSAEFTPGQLAALPHISVTVFNDHTHASETYSGVPLSDLLPRVGVPTSPRGKDFLLYLVAEGSDGYRVVFSLAEVLPAVHDATVLVVDAQDGHPISAAEGPFKLIASREKHPSRWVHNLVAIHIQSAGG